MKRSKLVFLIYVLAVIGLTTLNLGSGVGEWSEHDIGPFRVDHWVHLMLFLPWGAVTIRFLKDLRVNDFDPSKIQNIENQLLKKISPDLISVIAGLILAVGTEFVQKLVGYRVFSVEDMGFNGVGLAVGYIGYWFYIQK